MQIYNFSNLKSHFDTAPLFKKVATMTAADLEFVEKGRERKVETIIHGQVETTRMAQVGDVILTGPEGEQYVSSIRSFNSLHAKDVFNPDIYHAQHVVKALFLSDDAILKTSWGEDMYIPAGGVAVLRLNDDKFYGNQAKTFAPTYWRAIETDQLLEPRLLCPMTLRLNEQMEVAENARAREHVLDILDRLAWRSFPDEPSSIMHSAKAKECTP